MKTIYIVRHASAGDNDNALFFKGVTDIPLSPDGEIGAAAVARKFKNIDIDTVYTGPLTRARRTAEEIARVKKLENVVSVDELNDINCGEWEGMSIYDAEKNRPELFETWRDFPGEFEFPNGGSVKKVAQRAFSLVEKIVAGPGDTTVILVTHRLVINVIIMTALGIDLNKFWRFRHGHCGISKLIHDKNIFTIERLNSTAP